MAKILIVDDNDDMRDLLRAIVELRGHEVVEAENGRDGIEKFRTAPCDVVFTDIIMPDMDGNEVITELRSAAPGLKIVAVSGGGRARNLGILEVATRFGADRVLSKPFRKDEVLKALDELVKA